MNRIRLTGGYYIEIDNLNHILKEVRVVKKGKNAGQEYDRIVGYYSNLEGAIRAFLKAYQLDNGTNEKLSFADYIQEITQLNEEAVRLIRAGIEEE